MPVIFNEPLSFLQRLTEYMEHTYLIHKASSFADPVERMQVRVTKPWERLKSRKVFSATSPTSPPPTYTRRIHVKFNVRLGNVINALHVWSVICVPSPGQ